MPQTDHELYMRRALELAELGRGHVSPNPMVGCVIVHEGRIIGEGWHRRYGQAHAEVNAVQSVADKALLSQSTVYVTLEPCAHFGKTPPCADLLVNHRVQQVVIANVDTNPLVGGKGIQKLEAAGISVVTGVLEQEGRALNKRFFTCIEKRRPYVILKWAQTADGFIARSHQEPTWISNALARKLVHKWRTEEDAVLVGTHTARHDNPHLNVREWIGRNPVRVVLDCELSLPPSLYLFDQTQRTICLNLLKDETIGQITYNKLEPASNLAAQILEKLYTLGLQSVIVEGGSQLLNQFIASDLWDEARVFKAYTQFGSGIPAPNFNLLAYKPIDVLDNELYWCARA